MAPAKQALLGLAADFWNGQVDEEIATAVYMGMRAALVNPVYAATLCTLFSEELQEPWNDDLDLAFRCLMARHPIAAEVTA